MRLGRSEPRRAFTFHGANEPPAGNVTVTVGVATALGVTTAPTVKVDRTISAAVALGTALAATAVVIQVLRPDADIANGGWATAPLWSKVDEASAGGDVITATAS
jgi:hypothetical protein